MVAVSRETLDSCAARDNGGLMLGRSAVYEVGKLMPESAPVLLLVTVLLRWYLSDDVSDE